MSLQLSRKPPKITKLTSGSGTFIPSENKPLFMRVRMVGGGGGGGGSGTGAGPSGTAGGDTIFTGSLHSFTAGGGSPGGGAGGGNPGAAGGVPSYSGTGFYGDAFQGNRGQDGIYQSTGVLNTPRAMGGTTVFSGNGYWLGEIRDSIPNSGAGGGSGSMSTSANSYTGSGGGAGAHIDFIVTEIADSYSWSIGVKGDKGPAGTSGEVGGDGGSGVIIIEEHFQ